MRIQRIDIYFQNIHNQISQNHIQNTQIEAELTKYALIILVAEYELEIKKIINTFLLSLSNDPKCQNIYQNLSKRCLKFPNFKKDEVVTLLNKIDRSYGNNYSQLYDSLQQNQKAQITSIINNRNIAAHEAHQSIQMTFSDVIQAYNDTHIILDYIRQSLI